MPSRWRLVVGLAGSLAFVVVAVQGLRLDAFAAAPGGAPHPRPVPGLAAQFLLAPAGGDAREADGQAGADGKEALGKVTTISGGVFS